MRGLRFTLHLDRFLNESTNGEASRLSCELVVGGGSYFIGGDIVCGLTASSATVSMLLE